MRRNVIIDLSDSYRLIDRKKTLPFEYTGSGDRILQASAHLWQSQDSAEALCEIRIAHHDCVSKVTARSISSSVVSRPRLKRMAPMPTSGDMPMAASTGESVTSPE